MNIVITGGSSGLGAAIMAALDHWTHDHNIANWSLETGVNVTNRAALEDAASCLPHGFSRVDALINCAGVNRPAYIEDIEPMEFGNVMAVNAMAAMLTMQALLPRLAHGGTVLNIVSNAAEIPMTASLAYNASKAALAIMTKQMHRELFPRHGITVFGISPNLLAGTPMTEAVADRIPGLRGWTKEEALIKQREALAIYEPTDPAALADFIAYLLSTKQRHKYLGGCIIPYGA